MATDNTLTQAIAACKAGRKAEARQLLKQILQRDRSNEVAWLWLSQAVETRKERIVCLENVLVLNPDNEMARRGLQILQATPGAPPSSTAARPASPQSPPATSVSAVSQPVAPQAPSSSPVSWPATLQGAQAPEPQSTPGPSSSRTIIAWTATVVGAVIGFMVMSAVLNSLLKESDKVEWQEFTSEEGRFSIVMPGKPSSDVQSINTPVGILDMYTFTVEKGGNDYYYVGYSDYPEYITASADAEVMLDGARDGMLTSVQGKLLSEQWIKFQGHSGRELMVEVTAQGQVGIVHVRVYLVGNRLYQIFVIGLKDQFPTSQTERFLNSFRLLEQ